MGRVLQSELHGEIAVLLHQHGKSGLLSKTTHFVPKVGHLGVLLLAAVWGPSSICCNMRMELVQPACQGQ